MKEFTVTCWASEEISVEAETEEQAKEIASEQCQFQWVDYCEVDEEIEG